MNLHERILKLVIGRAVRPKPDATPRKRPPKGSAPAMAEPPRGPLPLAGGAEAPLEFDS
jgi:hypothetical protein